MDRASQLVAIEGLALPVLLDDRQLAQLHALECREAGGAADAETSPPDRAAILGRPRILDLRVIGAAERTAHFLLLIARPRRRGRSPRLRSEAPVHRRVDRKAGAQPADGAPHALLRRGIAAGIFRQALQHIADPQANLAEFGGSEATRRRRRRAQANARGDGRLLRVERDTVFVAGDAGTLQRLLGVAPG